MWDGREDTRRGYSGGAACGLPGGADIVGAMRARLVTTDREMKMAGERQRRKHTKRERREDHDSDLSGYGTVQCAP